MKKGECLLLFSFSLLAITIMAEERRFFAGYLFTNSAWDNYENGYCGTSNVFLDSVQECYAFYYTGLQKPIIVHPLLINESVVVHLDSSKNNCTYYGKTASGMYFVEKQFLNRPSGEGIIFYKIPEIFKDSVAARLRRNSFLPSELFRDSLYRLMDYKLTGVFWDKYEEGRFGCALVNLGYAKSCVAFYFNGAMVGTPLYLNQIKEIEYVTRSDSSQADCKYSSKTGRMDYGMASDGTYFVEKLFYENQYGLPQGIILYYIPEDYFEDVLEKIVLLPCLPLDIFGYP